MSVVVRNTEGLKRASRTTDDETERWMLDATGQVGEKWLVSRVRSHDDCLGGPHPTALSSFVIDGLLSSTFVPSSNHLKRLDPKSTYANFAQDIHWSRLRSTM